MALGTAFRAFFAALFQRDMAERLRLTLEQPSGTARIPSTDVAAPHKSEIELPVPPSKSPQSNLDRTRSDSLTLLSALQREARFVDLVKENLGQYSDAQIGAAARPCLQQCASTLDRLFGLRAIESSDEGSMVTVPESASPTRYQWIGEGSGTSGKLVHHGWEAARVELPKWVGSTIDSLVVAPVQVKRP